MSRLSSRAGLPALLRRLADDVRYRRLPGRVRLLHEFHLLRARGRARLRPQPAHREPEIHAFVLWSNALPETERILADIKAEFDVLEVARVAWPAETFSWNLTRFYGGNLPPHAQKERHCGSDPFLVVVVRDRAPVYEPRRSSKGIVNARMFDAKQRYRRWTGGGHRVHASTDRTEAEHDLFLLSGRPAAVFAASGAWNGETAKWPDAVAGDGGWPSVEDLLYAVGTSTPYVRLHDVDGVVAADGTEPLALNLLVRNVERAALSSNVEPGGAVAGAGHVLVGGLPALLDLGHVGDGSLDSRWQRAMLRHRRVDERGIFVPAPSDAFHAFLHHVIAHRDDAVRYDAAALGAAAERISAPAGDYGERDFVTAVLNRYLERMGYRYVGPGRQRSSWDRRRPRRGGRQGRR